MNWKLEGLYSNTKQWENDYKQVEDAAKEFQAYKGRLSRTSQDLLNAFKADL
ncbi:hypothetical protein [Microaerobacter geothermalis]|uniref:hypothetical protein n=1 Tax=Microaerobacter geothermalis TaxID=674972 RepID=UPI001F397305|nr:hypothetical protein [Microaerobacter geothermalis]